MGRLHRLELENFKSYNGKQIIGPFDNFTCIIGPNGAGKSNMMDAISFVLGVQSKHLRSTHLKELIYRKDADSAPARKASVLLVYAVEDDEIEGHAKGSEIHFSRSISASGVSSYRLGGKEVTFEVYESLLLKIGVLVKARNFLVFQGDVETVASKSPLELTKLLEQICGSDALIGEYEELLRQRDQAEENTLTSLSKKKFIVTESKTIKSQKDEADYFQLKQEELNEVKTEHTLWQIWRIKSDMEEHQKTTEDLKIELETLTARQAEIDEELQEGKKELAKVQKEMNSEEKDLQGKQKQLDGILPKLSDVRAKLKSLQKRAAEQKKREDKESAELAEQAENLENLRSEIASTTKLEAKLSAELNGGGDGGSSGGSGSGSNINKLGAGDWSEYSRLREQVSSRAAVERTNELALELELKGKQHQLAQLEGQQRAIQEELAATAKNLQAASERSALLHEAAKANEQQYKELSAEKVRRTRESETAATSLRELRAEQEQLSVKLRNAGDDKRRNKQEDRISEAIKSMQLQYKGVHGKLVDFCRPTQKKYAQAIMVAAGKSMDAIVVDTTHTAAECMRYLKEQKVGVCQFLPLDNISAAPISEKLRTFGAKFRPCFDVVECDETYRPAVLYAVGSTVVCDTLEDAQDLCFRRNERVKAVTLGGQIISKSGAMTGGTAAGDVRQDRWAEQDLERLRKQHDGVTARISDLEHSANAREFLVSTENTLKGIDATIKFNHADIKVLDEKISQLKQQKGLHDKKLDGLSKELTALRAEIAKLEAQLSKLQQNTREIEQEIFRDFSARVGVTNIREYEEQTLRRQQKVVQQHGAVSKKLASLTSQLEFEQSRNCQQVLDTTRAEIKATKEEISKLQEQEGSLLDKELKVRASIRGVNETLAKLKTQSQNISYSMNSVQGRRADLESSKESLNKKIASEDHIVERCRMHLHEVLQKAQVDEVALPTVEEEVGEGGSEGPSELSWTGNQSQSQLFSSGKRGVKRSAASGAGEDESESDTGTGTGSSSSGAVTGRGSKESTHYSQSHDPKVVKDKNKMLKVDLSSLRVHKNLSKARMNEKEAELVKKISDLMQELDKIQPNMHAAERYAGLLEKLKDCNDELDNTKELARDVTTRFDEVKRTRLTLFQECYDHVSRSLGQIYKDLTKSSKHPMGGNAYLTLDNTDEPYLGGIRFTAMPPMKRFRDMEQLSGGEKTMAALALLFSIHRRAPFFVLDEVDAALDNVNVKKLCNYIRQTSDNFQCVVISLKDMFFEHADSLVGICKDVDSLSSQVLTLDLKAYDQNTGPGTGSQVPPSPLSSVGGGSNSKTSTPSKGSVASAGEQHRHQHYQQQGQQLGKRRGAGDGGRRMAPQPLYQQAIEEGDEDQDE